VLVARRAATNANHPARNPDAADPHHFGSTVHWRRNGSTDRWRASPGEADRRPHPTTPEATQLQRSPCWGRLPTRPDRCRPLTRTDRDRAHPMCCPDQPVSTNAGARKHHASHCSALTAPCPNGEPSPAHRTGHARCPRCRPGNGTRSWTSRTPPRRAGPTVGAWTQTRGVTPTTAGTSPTRGVNSTTTEDQMPTMACSNSTRTRDWHSKAADRSRPLTTDCRSPTMTPRWNGACLHPRKRVATHRPCRHPGSHRCRWADPNHLTNPATPRSHWKNCEGIPHRIACRSLTIPLDRGQPTEVRASAAPLHRSTAHPDPFTVTRPAADLTSCPQSCAPHQNRD
jgi:hypothetical protein